jgi:hypothetical protein
MSKIGKPYERPLSPELAGEILNIPFQEPVSDLSISATIGEYVERATKAVEAANEMLATSAIAQIVARSLMRDLKKRGVPSIYVASDGTVMFRVSYEETEPQAERVVPVVRTQQSDLPKLAALRKEADDLGLDIGPLGRQRRAIFDLIEEHKTKTATGVDEVTVSPAKKAVTVPKARISSTKAKKKAPTNGTSEPILSSETPAAPLDAGEFSFEDLIGGVAEEGA